MNPNAVARAGIMSAQYIVHGAVYVVVTRTDTTSAMLQILKRYARNGRKTVAENLTDTNVGNIEYISREG